MWKYKSIFITSILVLFLGPTNLGAQGGMGRGLPFLGRGPLTLGIQYDYFDPADHHQVIATLSQTGMGGFRRDRTSSLIQISTLMLAGGVLFNNSFDTTKFRWRAGFLDVNINRKLLFIGGTLLDYDQSKLLEKDFRWFNLRLGFAPILGKHSFFISPKAIGTFGAGSWKLGNNNYSALGNVADTTYSGMEGGFQVGLDISFLRRLHISTDYSERILVDGQEPHFKTWKAELRYLVGKIGNDIVNLYIQYQQQNVEILDSDSIQENIDLRAGVQITFIPEIPPVKPWW
jgi:hypothetical protein